MGHFGNRVAAGENIGQLISELKPGLVGSAPGTLGPGVLGIGKEGEGVEGISDSGPGVSGYSKSGPGVWAESQSGDGLYAKASAGHLAGNFQGSVSVTGNIHATGDIKCAGDICCASGDCAEYFDVEEANAAEPGTVMVLTREGALCPSRTAYDKRVAGVISGAGSYRPAILLDVKVSKTERRPIALVGKVYCKVDASQSPVEVGDLLTTSDKPGHAMKATNPQEAFGAVMGKALRPLAAGQGLIPVLVTLQ